MPQTRRPKSHRAELLETRVMLDGTAELVREFNEPIESVVFNDSLYFWASSDTDGSGLWKSDGTQSGTELVQQVSDSFEFLGTTNSHLYYANDRWGSIWATDGDTTNPVLLGSNFVSPRHAVVLNDQLYVDYHNNLWSVDTATWQLQRVRTFGQGLKDVFVAGDSIYVVDFFNRLWQSDGTESGTTPIRTLDHDLRMDSTEVVGENAVYTDNLNGVTWRLDVAGEQDSVVFGGTALNWSTALTQAFFTTDEGPVSAGERNVWRTDGTASGTYALHNAGSLYPDHLTVVGDELYYTIGDGLWHSDGTADGTRQILNLEINSSFTMPSASNGSLYFSMQQDDVGQELWRVRDGSAELLDVVEGKNGSFPSPIGGVDDSTLFAAAIGLENVLELWVADDDSSAISILSTEIRAAFTGDGGITGPIVPVKDGFVFVANREVWFSDGSLGSTHRVHFRTEYEDEAHPLFAVNGRAFTSRDYYLWVTDGSDSGTHVFEVPDHGMIEVDPYDATFVVANQTLFFRGYSEASGEMLWASDGTPEGTHPIYDFQEFGSAGSIIEDAGTLYFLDGDNLVRTDGSRDSVEILGALPPTNFGERELVGHNGRVYVINPQSGYQVWSTDGAQQLEQILFVEFASHVTTIADSQDVYIGFGNIDGGGSRYWVTDGTVSGTSPVDFGDFQIQSTSNSTATRLFFARHDEDFSELGVRNSQTGDIDVVLRVARAGISVMEHIGDQMYFRVHADLTELWISDGTAAGTRKVADVDASGYPSSVSVIDGRLYFSGTSEGEEGRELWRTDGTLEGTVQLTDIGAKSGFSAPKYMTRVDGHVYFRADDGFGGQELWRVPFDHLGDEPVPGDADGNGTVDFEDFLLLSMNFGRTDDVDVANGDFDSNGEVDFNDFLVLSANFGKREEPESNQ